MHILICILANSFQIRLETVLVSCFFSIKPYVLPTGWWYTYPSEKYESQWEGLSHILWNIKFMFQTTNQPIIKPMVYPNSGISPGSQQSGCISALSGSLHHTDICQKTHQSVLVPRSERSVGNPVNLFQGDGPWESTG